jgi:hypothetical protein
LNHLREAFGEAATTGKAILAFTDHDYRDIRRDVEAVRAMLAEVRPEFPDVRIRFSGAEAAARDLLDLSARPQPRLSILVEDGRAVVRVEGGEIFSSQPFLSSAQHGRISTTIWMFKSRQPVDLLPGRPDPAAGGSGDIGARRGVWWLRGCKANCLK